MNNQTYELSSCDLDEVCGGLRAFPIAPPVSSKPVPPPVLGHGPVLPPAPTPGPGPIAFNGSGIFEL